MRWRPHKMRGQMCARRQRDKRCLIFWTITIPLWVSWQVRRETNVREGAFSVQQNRVSKFGAAIIASTHFSLVCKLSHQKTLRKSFRPWLEIEARLDQSLPPHKDISAMINDRSTVSKAGDDECHLTANRPTNQRTKTITSSNNRGTKKLNLNEWSSLLCIFVNRMQYWLAWHSEQKMEGGRNQRDYDKPSKVLWMHFHALLCFLPPPCITSWRGGSEW